MAIAIRQGAAADVAAMHAIRTAVSENRLSDPRSVTEESYLSYTDRGWAWVAESEAGITGFAAVDVAKGEVWALFVRPAAQGSGVGRALHAHMLAEARAAGLKRLTLTTGQGTRAERFYREAGWTPLPGAPAGELRFALDLA